MASDQHFSISIDFDDRKIHIPGGMIVKSEDQIVCRVKMSKTVKSEDLFLFQTDRQKKRKFTSGDYLMARLIYNTTGGLTASAHLLDFFLKNMNVIPNNWKTKKILFPGTIYRNGLNMRIIRYLCWNGSSWYWDYRSLVDGFNEEFYVLIIKLNTV